MIAAGSLLVLIREMPYCADVMALLLAGAVLYLGRIASREGSDERAEIVEPVMYGLAIALFALLIVSTAIMMFGGGLGADMKEVRAVLIGKPTAFGFVLALLWLMASIFDEHGAPPAARKRCCRSWRSSRSAGSRSRRRPITATMLMLALGFDRRARALIALSTVFFLMFGTAYLLRPAPDAAPEVRHPRRERGVLPDGERVRALPLSRMHRAQEEIA